MSYDAVQTHNTSLLLQVVSELGGNAVTVFEWEAFSRFKPVNPYKKPQLGGTWTHLFSTESSSQLTHWYCKSYCSSDNRIQHIEQMMNGFEGDGWLSNACSQTLKIEPNSKTYWTSNFKITSITIQWWLTSQELFLIAPVCIEVLVSTSRSYN